MSQPSIVKISLTVAGFLAALIAIGTPVFFAGRWVASKDKDIDVGNLTQEIGRLRSTIVRKIVSFAITARTSALENHMPRTTITLSLLMVAAGGWPWTMSTCHVTCT